MLPEAIAQRGCALARARRGRRSYAASPVSEDGSVGDAASSRPSIRSRAKLSYFAVDRYLKATTRP
jgi:exoribonuclease R